MLRSPGETATVSVCGTIGPAREGSWQAWARRSLPERCRCRRDTVAVCGAVASAAASADRWGAKQTVKKS